MMKRMLTLMLAATVMAVALAGCGKDRASKQKDTAIPVRVMKVKAEDLNKALEYVGSITGQDEALVYPKVSGKIIEKVKDEGSHITKGETIAYIDRDEVGLKFEKAPVESPLTGIVGRVYVDIGSNVTQQTAVAMVADMDKAEIDLDIPEKYLPKVLLGQEAEITVDAYPDDIFMGRVTMISPVVDIQTRAAPIEIKMDNKDHRLQPGMFANVKLILEKKKDVPVVLREAVMGKVNDTYVYAVENSRAVLKSVEVGIRQGPLVEISKGLKKGDMVVIMGQQRLRDGAQVTTEE